jgi:adenine-specific DNA-methyltransferase
MGTTERMRSELESIGIPFQYPKPKELLQYLVGLGVDDGGIVLDFFAGSGTTAHAVWLEQIRKNRSLRVILCQLPEPIVAGNEQHYSALQFCQANDLPLSIAEISKARLHRTAAMIESESATPQLDFGFRVFKLDSSNVRAWDPTTQDLATDLLAHARHDKSDRSERDFLYEVILKRGLDLCIPVDEKKIAGKTVFGVGGGILFCCFADSIVGDEVTAIGEGIAAWKEELKPADAPAVIFKDSAFADDVAKANITETLRQHGIEDVRSL